MLRRFLCTAAAAEVLYRASTDKAAFVISSTSLPHYGRWIADATVGQRVEQGSPHMASVVAGQRELADGFLAIVREYGGKDGSLHEQFDRCVGPRSALRASRCLTPLRMIRIDGTGRGARDLTFVANPHRLAVVKLIIASSCSSGGVTLPSSRLSRRAAASEVWRCLIYYRRFRR